MSIYIYTIYYCGYQYKGISYFNHVKCYDEMQLNETHTDREQCSLSINNCTVRRVKIYSGVTLIMKIMNTRLEYHSPCYTYIFHLCRGIGYK